MTHTRPQGKKKRKKKPNIKFARSFYTDPEIIKAVSSPRGGCKLS